jgi:hypothetical protein
MKGKLYGVAASRIYTEHLELLRRRNETAEAQTSAVGSLTYIPAKQRLTQ